MVSANPIEAPVLGSIGPPLMLTEIEVRDEAGQALPVGEVGELCVRGPQIMREYWHAADETAGVLEDGWLRTGDLARLDEQGYIFIVDRKKDMILVSGFNVYPNEIEEVLVHHPGISEVAVVGRPDTGSGEAVVACVVLSDRGLTSDSIRQYAKKELVAYKVPKTVLIMDELPKSNVGKVLRRLLREQLEESSQMRARAPLP